MTQSEQRPQPHATFEHTAQIEVQRAEFFLLASVPYLDLGKLAQSARAEVELGYFETDSCHHFVRARVREGKVTDLVAEPCSDDKPEPASAELVRLLDAARRHVTSPDHKPFQPPIPVAEFMPQAARITIQTITCVKICIFGFCFVCCSNPAGTTWFCGDRVIVHS